VEEAVIARTGDPFVVVEKECLTGSISYGITPDMPACPNATFEGAITGIGELCPIIDMLQFVELRQSPIGIAAKFQIVAVFVSLLPIYPVAFLFLRPHEAGGRVGPSRGLRLASVYMGRGSDLRFCTQTNNAHHANEEKNELRTSSWFHAPHSSTARQRLKSQPS